MGGRCEGQMVTSITRRASAPGLRSDPAVRAAKRKPRGVVSDLRMGGSGRRTALPSSIASRSLQDLMRPHINCSQNMRFAGQSETMDKASLKPRVIHELRQYLTVLLFLAPLFGAFSTYRMLFQGRFREGSFEYGT